MDEANGKEFAMAQIDLSLAIDCLPALTCLLKTILSLRISDCIDAICDAFDPHVWGRYAVCAVAECG